jgi:hypothetical protein
MVNDWSEVPWLTELVIGGSIFAGCLAGAMGW